MSLETFHFKDTAAIAEHIRAGIPSLYHGSRTSTVIPFEKLEGTLQVEKFAKFALVDLGSVPGVLRMEGDNLLVRGNVTWQEAREFCLQHGRNVMTSPTEDSPQFSPG